MVVVSSKEEFFMFPLIVEYAHVCLPAGNSSAALLYTGDDGSHVLESRDNCISLGPVRIDFLV